MSDKIITVEQFYQENQTRLKLKLMTTEAGYFRVIDNYDMHRPGLALAGFGSI